MIFKSDPRPLDFSIFDSMRNVIWIILLASFVVGAQGSYNRNEASNVLSALSQGRSDINLGGSTTEADMVNQILARERAKSQASSTTNLGQGGSGNLGDNNYPAPLTAQDSSMLFLSKDTLLVMPFAKDTLFYVYTQDTIPIDSLSLDTTIVERVARAPDPSKVVVRRKRQVPREEIRGVERYEIQFFRRVPASLFGSITNAINGDYPLKAGDKLVLTLWGEVEKESEITVNNQGKLMVEGIGLNSVNDMTLSEAEEVLRQKLGKIYSGISRKKTFVNLRLESLSPVKIFLVGDVDKPGGYVFYGNTSIFQALYLAGGPTKTGSVRNIQVTRGDTSYTVDLYEYLMFGRKPEPSVLRDGDIVFLPRAEILAQAKGDVGRPAIYELKKGESVKDLIQFAGGVNVSAAQQRMVVQRFFPDGRKDFIDLALPREYLDGKQTFAMQDGDVLLLNKSSEKPVDYVTVIGAIKYPGTYQFKSGMKAPELVATAGGVLEDTYQGRIQVLRTVPTGGLEMHSQTLKGEPILLAPRDTVVVYSLKDMFKPDSVTISGAVLKPGKYEFYPGMTAKDLILRAGGFLPNREKGILRLEHVRKDSRGMSVERIQIQDNYEAQTRGQIPLLPWDHMEVPVDPNFQRPQKVKLTGAFKSPGEYSLLFPGEKLKSLIERSGGFQADAYLEGAQFFRNKDSIGQIGFSLVQTMEDSKRENVELQDLDSIYVPVAKLHIRVVGEVGYPANVLYKPGKSIAWYIIQAGGFRETSDLNRVMIRYANGSVSTEYDAERDPDPGSTIIVPYKNPPEPVDWYKIASTFAALVTAAATLLIALKR